MPLRWLTVRPRGVHLRDREARGRDSHQQKQYSIERLCALQMYTESTSMLRVLGACVGTIVIPLLSVLVLDILPLQPPEAGWDKNVSLWCRDFTMTTMVTSGALIQLSMMAPAAELTVRSIARIAFVVTCCYTASVIAIAKFWMFPIPFSTVVLIPAWLTFLLLATGCTIRVDKLQQNAVLKTQMLRFAYILSLESCLLLVYPVYSVVFASLTGGGQLALLFLLPVIKYAFKKMMKRAVADLEDLVPTIAVGVDFFNALYQSKCMQSSGSILATAGIIGLDMVQNIVSLYNLFSSVRELEVLLDADLLSKGAIASAIEIASQPTQLDARELLDVRVISCGHFRLTERYTKIAERFRVLQDETRRSSYVAAPTPEESNELLVLGGRSTSTSNLQPLSDDNETRPSTNTVTTSTSASDQKVTPASVVYTSEVKRSAPRWSQIFKSTAVHPVGTGSQLSRNNLTGKEKVIVLKRTLELLWRCELVLLVEYVEAVIPVMYAIYLAILYQLPNAKYYPETVSMDSAHLRQAITSILIYGVLELFSLVCVHLVLKRLFKLSPLHQVAFTLESEWQLIQGTFTTWAVVVLPLTLAHHGADFTFRFAWVSASKDH